jgi:hypothetical protein
VHSGSGMAITQIVFKNEREIEELFFLKGIVSNGYQKVSKCNLEFYTMFTSVKYYIDYIGAAERRFPST